MDWIQIESVAPPLDQPDVAARVAATVRRADAMGLLGKPRAVTRLDLAGLRKLLAPVQAAGIARQPIAELADSSDAAQATRLLERVNDALTQSPWPSKEWLRAETVLGAELLSRLLGISEASLRRYRSGRRETPDDAASRLHFIVLLISDLAGAYNDIGVRRWFDRARSQLDGKAPAAFLRGAWHPEQTDAGRVRELAESLTGSPAT
jgi:hypothetical protein